MTNLDQQLTNLLPLGIGLIVYFALHSLLASLWLKQQVSHRWPELMPAYRLAYNLLSIILLIPLLWLAYRQPGPLIWQWSGLWGWIMDGMALMAVIGFTMSLKAYDTQVFLGLQQWRQRNSRHQNPRMEQEERLSISLLHRFVRHPWYFFGLVIIWTRDISLSKLVLFGLATAYLVIGSRLEERKLVVQYGVAYQQYCKQVAGLIPLPWRWLSKKEAEELAALAAKPGSLTQKDTDRI